MLFSLHADQLSKLFTIHQRQSKEFNQILTVIMKKLLSDLLDFIGPLALGKGHFQIGRDDPFMPDIKIVNDHPHQASQSQRGIDGQKSHQKSERSQNKIIKNFHIKPGLPLKGALKNLPSRQQYRFESLERTH